jgi:hypothetical protein
MNRLLLLSVMVLSLSMAGVARAEEAGGVAWTAPAEWAVQPERPMRAATYSIPAAKGDGEPAELAVFYFGEGKGGGVDANVKRWVNQFKKTDGSSLEKEVKPKQEQIAGLPVTWVDVKGTYMGGGPMMGPASPKPGYRLIGAIVESPAGALFFKLTGPERTVTAVEKPFHKMLEGMKKK